ncbi:MAG: hypothetical protein PVI20_15015 [Desulfobacteraceae bacterium]
MDVFLFIPKGLKDPGVHFGGYVISRCANETAAASARKNCTISSTTSPELPSLTPIVGRKKEHPTHAGQFGWGAPINPSSYILDY